jgi:hypothetical protein
LQQSREVPNVILQKTNIGDTEITRMRDNEVQQQVITAQDTAIGPASSIRVYSTVSTARLLPGSRLMGSSTGHLLSSPSTSGKRRTESRYTTW